MNISDGELGCLPVPHGSQTTLLSGWIQGTALPFYQQPNNIDTLYQNFAIFNRVRNFCKENLEVELERLLKEAESTVEYLTSKDKFYDAAVLVDLMTASPSSYTTNSINARSLDRVSMESPYLGILIENEKKRGQLLYYIKSATIPSANYAPVYKSALQYSDIRDAQAILQRFIEEHLRGALSHSEEGSKNSSSTVYHRIDPLEHRICSWAENDTQLQTVLQNIDITTTAMGRNLLGETGLCIARKHDFSSPQLGIIGYRSIKNDNTATDVRGCGVILATILAGHWNEAASDIIREARAPEESAFFSQVEVPGLDTIQKAFPGFHPRYSNRWSYLDSYQLATLMGNLDFIQQVDTVAPSFFAKAYNRHHGNEDSSIYGYLRGILPELPLAEYHPVILSALAGHIDITRYHLEKNPELSKLETNSWNGRLGALFLIAFKRSDIELLGLLNEVALFELSNGERVVLSRKAAGLAAPIVFQTWMNLAWFDLSGFTWGQESIRCELWRAILGSLQLRYEGTQGTEDRDIQNEKARFIEVIWAMEQSMYLARCGCPSCEEHYLEAHQVLSTFDQS
ncbi:hypothetical protein TWF506_010541 [Arthrobotrys conoides]|uniref:Uncharacterized protein n=1 Tax=Arthrobotrys conoides TaxID=74498 RepID=A0AAN8N8X1_9PEZI